MGKVRIKQIGTSIEDLKPKEEKGIDKTPTQKVSKRKPQAVDSDTKKREKPVHPRQLHGRSKRYKKAADLKSKFKNKKSSTLSYEEAVRLVKKTATCNFTETIEAHINLREKFQTSLKLPYGEKLELKTEKKFPVIHTKIGRKDMSEKELIDNLKALIKVISEKRIKKITLSSTMGPSISFQP